MKVLYVTHYPEIYGANKSMLSLIEDLKKRYAVEATILCVGKGTLNKEAYSSGIPIINCRYASWMKEKTDTNPVNIFIKKVLSSLILYPVIKQKVKIHEFDIVHCNTSLSNLGAKLALKNHIPLIWHVREFGDKDYGLRYSYSYNYVKNKFKQANAIIMISKAIENYFKNKFELDNMHLIYNGVKKFNVKKINHNKVRFCCVGMLIENKNQLEILNAAKLLQESGNSDFEIHFYGDGNDEYVQILKKFVCENRLVDMVIFHGYTQNVLEQLGEMDVGIMSSVKEAFGRVTVEYMMARMPVIGANSGGTPEIISNHISGVLYTSGNVFELSKCMKKYIDNKNLIAEQGEKGHRIANDYFSMEANTDQIYKIYNTVLDK